MTDDVLNAGFFTFKDASRLTGIASTRRVRAWVDGWPGRSQALIRRDFEGSTLSFLDLMEIRFVEHFRSNGVRMTTIRRAAENLRGRWKVAHPFAHQGIDRYLTDRREIFAKVAMADGDVTAWNLATDQLEMWEAIEQTIADGVDFDPATAMARSWRPRAREFPSVLIDPRHAFGSPVVGARAVPTAALFRQWNAEGGDTARVAKWYGTSEQDVADAVGFERALAA
jgi:uncharacterized protein (DUF433 family)